MREKSYIVYLHINKINGKIYVGITKYADNPNRRWMNGNGYKKDSIVYKAINKYGWDNFNHIIFCNHLQSNDYTPKIQNVEASHQTILNNLLPPLFTGLSVFFSISLLALSISSKRCISTSASSRPRCVQVFIVMPISLWPIKYCSVLGFIPDFAILLQYVWRHTWGEIFGRGTRYISLYRPHMCLNRCDQCIATSGMPSLSIKRNPLY